MKKLFLILFFATSLFRTSLFAQWQKQTIPVNKPISGIKFIDSLRGWACTNISILNDTSYIINTTNSGTAWNIQYSAYGTFFNSISVINNTIAYVGGYDGVNNIYILLKSTNSGLSWVNKNPPSVPSDLFFLNQDSGWYCDDFIGPDVRTTTDGGTTWQLRNSGLTDNINRLFFLNYSTGWAGSTYFKKTTNAGLNWIQIYDFTTDIYSIYFVNEQTGWVGLSNNRIRYTTNGGFNWINQTVSPPTGIVHELFFYNNNLGWAGFLLDKIFKTTNGGMVWGYQTDTVGSYRFSFIDSMKGWAAQNGIAHTTNGGGPIIYVGIININNNVPNTYKLYQNYPNPFNSQTNIKFSITKRSFVQFKVYDILGREKTMWQSERHLDAGTHQLQFDAKDFASGVYFYRIIVGDEFGNIKFKETKKMILVK